MRNVKLSKLWDQIHSSYWFIPAVMAVAAIALAFVMLSLDRTDKVEIDYWWIYTGGADGARSLLGTVAGSMISVAATAFSITIVALQLGCCYSFFNYNRSASACGFQLWPPPPA